jgi:Fic family protein
MSDIAYAPFPSFAAWQSEHFNPQFVDEEFAALAVARHAATAEGLARAADYATRAAAVDTGALEGLYATDRGFTRTVATQAAAWELALERRGPKVKLAIEDHLAAYEFVLNAATRYQPLTQVWVRELHEVICASQETYTVHAGGVPHEREFHKGVYKSEPNSPTVYLTGAVHAYALPIETESEMQRLVNELRSEPFETAHPIVQSAYAHYAYVCIHPFPDGNGRVARALASVFLYRLPGLPLLIFADQRAEYLDALAAADSGDHTAFITFVEERTVDAVGIVHVQVRAATTSVAEQISQLDHPTESAASYDAKLHGATRLLDSLRKNVEKKLKMSKLPSSISFDVHNVAMAQQGCPAGYRTTPNGTGFLIALTRAWPNELSIYWYCGIFISDAAGDSNRPELVASARDEDFQLPVRLRELNPVVTEAHKLKVDGWADEAVQRAVSMLLIRARR